MRYYFGTFAVLCIAWLLWSGLYLPLLLGLGAASCLLVLYLAHRIGFFDRHIFSLHLSPRLPPFWLWLLVEIIKANFAVARIVLHPRLPISPTLVEIDADTVDPVMQAILGNSITLTPGTVTVDIHRDRLKVHCLTRAAADTLRDGEMTRRIARLVRG
jgi:multicomponent Na+:H+ antiporter subunit E